MVRHIRQVIFVEHYPRKTLNLVCIKMAAILNSLSRDLICGGTISNHFEVIILSMKPLVRLKGQGKSLECNMFISEIDFHRLFDGILKIVFSIFSGVLHGKSIDFPAKKVRRISSYVIRIDYRSPGVC